MRRSWLALGLALALGLGLVACGVGAGTDSSDPIESSSQQLTVVLTGDGIAVASGARSNAVPDPPADPTHTLRWEMRDRSGDLVASGAVTDPRAARAESFDPTETAMDGVQGALGAVTVRVPNVDGVIEFTTRGADGSRVSLGSDHVFALESGRTSQSVLQPSQDVLGDPVAVVNNGDARGQVNLLIVPDGYTEAEMTRFHNDAARVIAGLHVVPGYAEHWSQFNIFVQDVRSRDSGVETAGAGAPLDTAFETAFGDNVSRPQRCVLPDAGSQPVVVAWLNGARQRLGADAVVILGNSDTYGGCAMPQAHLVTVTRHPEALRVLAHELGHTLFGLHDEYSTGGYACDTNINGPNVTNNPLSPPWADLIDAATLPTPLAGTAAGTIGAFEGARWCDHGLYRPTARCMMRELDAPLCPVCLRTIERQLAARRVDVGAAPAGVASVAVRVTNRTGAYLFARCNGLQSASCADWTLIGPDQSVAVRTPDRRLVLDNSTVPGASVTFARVPLNSPTDDATVYANVTDPLSEP